MYTKWQKRTLVVNNCLKQKIDFFAIGRLFRTFAVMIGVDIFDVSTEKGIR